MSDKIIKMTTYDVNGKKVYETTEPLEVYKWIAETMTYKHRGSKDTRRIEYNEQYDGHIHTTYYISNGVKVKTTIPR